MAVNVYIESKPCNYVKGKPRPLGKHILGGWGGVKIQNYSVSGPF